MACSLKDLESAKEILSANLFTQVINLLYNFCVLACFAGCGACLFVCLSCLFGCSFILFVCCYVVDFDGTVHV